MDNHNAHMDPQVMAELLRRYFSGELDDAAMHALEKRALADPFLAEAMEGYEAHPADQRAPLASLEERLSQRVAQGAATPQEPPVAGPGETPVVKLRRFDYRWAAAAAVLLLVAIGGYQWLHQAPAGQAPIAQEIPAPAARKDTPTVAQVPVADSPASPAAATMMTDKRWADSGLAYHVTPSTPAAPAIAPASSGGAPAPKANAASIQDQLAGKTAGLAVTQDAPAKAKAPKPLAETFVNRDANTPRADEQGGLTQDRITSLDTSARYFSRSLPVAARSKSLLPPQDSFGNYKNILADNQLKARKATAPESGAYRNEVVGFDKNAAAGKVIQGQVIDDNGKPLPGVVVRYKGAPTAVQTNMDGHFSLPAQDAEARRVEMQFVGFDKIDTTLYASNNDNHIALKPSRSALNDVVVLGYGSKKQEDNSSDASSPYQPPKPATGYDSLHRYLDNHLQSPGTPYTKLRVIFTVTPTGKLENFRVLNGVSDFVDAQVIELLKEGPAWKPASDARPAQVKLAVKVPAQKK